MKKKFLQATIILFSLLACQNKNDSNQIISVSDTLTDTTQTARKRLVYTKYNLPFPVDLYTFLNENDVLYDNTLLNSPTNLTKYNTSISKSINFGVYASNLAYCTVYGQNQDAMLYFKATKRLAADLNIIEGYDKDIIDRMSANINNSDSLLLMATNAYWSACNYLEQNNQINILPFIVAGGWLESVYLSLASVQNSDVEDKIYDKIIEQRADLENLLKYLLDVMLDSNTFEVNEDIQELGLQLTELKKVYQSFETDEEKIPRRKMHKLYRVIKNIRTKYTD